MRIGGISRFLGSTLILSLTALFPGIAKARETDAARVVVVANESLPESVALARWYMALREIPENNLIALPMPARESITRAEFENQILRPLESRLHAEGWMRGIPRGTGFETISHRIQFLVTVYGVPLRVEHGDAPMPWNEQIQMPPQQFKAASVDSELALLPRSFWPAEFAIQNPLFRRMEWGTTERNSVLRVSRLDGPSVASVRRSVEGALQAERLGLMGRAYVDVQGPVALGNDWMRDIAAQIKTLGFDLVVRDAPGTFGENDRFDAAALYFGWYAPRVNGPFLVRGMRLQPGAIAFHLHSFSAETIRNDSSAWLGPLIERGAAATFGNVAEPRLEPSHHPHLILARLIDGWALGDAAAYGTPCFSWQTVVLGDPLYRPFKVGLQDQMRGLRNLTPDQAQWVMIRRANLLREAGAAEEALELLRGQERVDPTPALTLHVARTELAAGNRERAAATLQKLLVLSSYSAHSWPVGAEVAALFAELGDVRSAVQVYDRMIGQTSLPKPARVALLDKAMPLADRSGDLRIRDRWQALLLELRPPPPPPAATTTTPAR